MLIVSISPLCEPFDGYAVRFEGSAWIVVHDEPILEIRETGTLEAWFFAESDQWRADLIRQSDGLNPSSNRAYETAYDGSVNVSFFIGPQGTSATVSLRSAPVLAEQWHHFATTIDTNAGVARLFIDGQLDSETTVLTDGTPIPHLPVRNSTYPVFIGGRPTLAGIGAGVIDEVRLWNIARSPDEIAAGYRQPMDPASPGLIAYYRLDEGTGITADNAAGPSANGGLRNSATWIPTVSCCTTDVNADGVVNSTDVSAFINLWFEDQSAGTLAADWDGNGVLNSTDVAEFINDWFEGVAAGCG
jgi:hypothetical protein